MIRPAFGLPHPVTRSKPVTAESVSYTHLDVYKRQVRRRALRRHVGSGGLPRIAISSPKTEYSPPAWAHRQVEAWHHPPTGAGTIGGAQRFLAPRLWWRLSGNRRLDTLDHAVEGGRRRQRTDTADIALAGGCLDPADRLRQ